MIERFHAAVSVAVLRRGRLLLLRRGPGERTYVGFWEMPGGAVESGESLAAAARREIREEACLRVVVGAPFHVAERASRRRRFLHVFLPGRGAGRPRAADGMDGVRWVLPAELRRLRMTLSERAAARAAFARNGPWKSP